MPKAPPDSSTRSLLVKYAGFILNRRPYFSSKLQNKLKEYSKKHKLEDTAEIIGSIISDLTKAGYLNDQVYAYGLVRRELSRGHGPFFIKKKLQTYNLSSDIIGNALETEATPQAIRDSLRKIVTQLPKEYPARQKVIAKIYRRGFTLDHLKGLFDSLPYED